MASLDCPSCGHQSPASAERCPECGLIFTPGIRRQARSGPELGKPVRVLIVLAVIAAGSLLVIRYQGRDRSGVVTAPPPAPASGEGLEPAPASGDSASTAQSPPQEANAVAVPQTTPAREPVAPPPARRVDTTPSTPTRPVTAPRAQAVDTAPETPLPIRRDTVPAVESPAEPFLVAARDSVPSVTPSAATLVTGAPLERFARTWVNMRAGRSGTAATVRTLRPGERVLVDSLADGWYRVVTEGRTEGYVDRSYVDEAAPTSEE
jgi:hypothetical protein